MNTDDLSHLLREWVRAVVYTHPEKIKDLDIRINSAGCDVVSGDFIQIYITYPVDGISVNMCSTIASIELRGMGMTGDTVRPVLHKLMNYWERLK